MSEASKGNALDWTQVVKEGPFLSVTELRSRLILQRIIQGMTKNGSSYGDTVLGVLNFLHRARFTGSRWSDLWHYAEAYLDGYLDRDDRKRSAGRIVQESGAAKPAPSRSEPRSGEAFS